MDLRQVVGEPLGLLRGQGGFLSPNAFLAFAVHAEAGVGQSSVGQSKVGVFVDGLFEEPDGLSIGVLAMTDAQGVSPLQNEIIGLYLLRRVGAKSGLFFVSRLEG